MKSTWPTQNSCVGDQTPPIFHLLMFGVGVGGNANFSVQVGGSATLAFVLGVMQILAFLDTNMLVYPTRNCSIGGLSQCKDPMRMDCVAVEYRL